LVIGVNTPYPPNEFKDTSGEIVGFDVDLMNAVARTLGLVPDYRETGFEAIIPSVRAGDFNVGMSSFTDTKRREAMADFVT
jgi:ABC-type amino acid transport substrate-binding protein